jgi:tRNA(fMet)-specific endonuclease VapC
MILLDSDHLSVLRYEEDPRCQLLRTRLDAAADRFHATSVITVEEQLRGWLAEIARRKDVEQQIPIYARLVQMLRFLEDWEIIAFDGPAALKFKELRGARVRIGSQDLKIACIAVVHDALLLSANLKDFRKVPGLRVESWID